MVNIHRNPSLPDYFVMGEGFRRYVEEYEGGNVIVFPQGYQAKQPSYWADLPTDQYPALRKLRTVINAKDPADVSLLAASLRKAGVDSGVAAGICENASELFSSLMPLYFAAFDGYKFLSTKAVFRLTTIRAENMHFDVYREPDVHHLARMFVNLDNQPRIWQTSWQAEAAVQNHSADLNETLRREGSTAALWMALSSAMFGKTSAEWWDNQPRQLTFFDPGDVWLVDSRQVAHQIFYGRRALSIDFAVDRETMIDPSRHYLQIAEAIRTAGR